MANLGSRLTLADRQAHNFGRTLVGVAIAATVSVAALCVYFQIFSGFAAWDDEGYLMFGVRYLLRGHRLYDEVYAQYGPFYYLVQWLYYTTIGKPVTHDLVRILAASLWIASATLLAWCVYRLTRRWILTGFAYFATLKVLSLFADGPGHPEEICLVLTASLLLICCFAADKMRALQAVILGLLLSALFLTKINIGLYVGLGLLFIVLATNPRLLLRRYIFGLAGLMSLLSVFALMHPLWKLGWARNYCILMILSISAALLVIAFDNFENGIGLRAWGIVAMAFAAGACLILSPFLLSGTTLYAAAWSTVFQYRNFSRDWYYSLPVGPANVCFAAASLALAVLWIWSRRRHSLHTRISFYLQILKGAVGLLVLAAASAGGNPHFIDVQLFKLMTPLLWLLLIPPAGKLSNGTFGRLSLCLLAVYLGLYAFPVAGAQVSLSLAVMLIATAAFVYDGWLSLAPAIEQRWMTPVIRRAGSVCLLLLLALLFLRRLTFAYRGYESLTPLDLPGASRVRVEKADRNTYHWLADQLNAQCDTFFSMPGLLSLYFWTHKDPPSLKLTTDWMGLMNSSQQQAIANDLSKYKRACIVYNPGLVEFWRRGQDLSKSPLANYIKNNFVSVGENRGYYFMVRNNH